MREKDTLPQILDSRVGESVWPSAGDLHFYVLSFPFLLIHSVYLRGRKRPSFA